MQGILRRIHLQPLDEAIDLQASRTMFGTVVADRKEQRTSLQLGVKEEEVTTESSFVNDLGADSLDTVELVMALEEEFETEIPDEEAEKITTVQQAIAYIEANL